METVIPPIESIPAVSVHVPLDDDPITEAITQIDTQSLPTSPKEPINWLFVTAGFLLYLSALGISVFYALTYPNVTIDLIPVEHALSTTTTVKGTTIGEHALAPVTRSLSSRAATTGKGHQDATYARGAITFYNGQFMSPLQRVQC